MNYLTDDADHMPYGCDQFQPGEDYDVMDSRDNECWQEFAEHAKTGWCMYDNAEYMELVRKFSSLLAHGFIDYDQRMAYIGMAHARYGRSLLGKLESAADKKWDAILWTEKTPRQADAMFAEWLDRVKSKL